MEHVLGMNMAKLIRTVERYPCIWDPSHEDYKTRFEKQRAWKEICETVIENYPDLDASSKLVTEKAIRTRWSNVRDYFIKSAKAAMNPNAEPVMKKKYTYYDLLLFLKKTIVIGNSEDSITEKDPMNTSSDDTAKDFQTSQKTKRKLAIAHSHTPHKTETIKLPRDEDAAFLESILPTMKKIPEDNKLGFKIELLSLLQKYNEGNVSPPLPEHPRRCAKTYHKPSKVEYNKDSVNETVSSEPKPQLFDMVVKVDVTEDDASDPELFEETYSEYNDNEVHEASE